MGLWPRAFVLVFISLGLLIALAGRLGVVAPRESPGNGLLAESAASGMPISLFRADTPSATTTPTPLPTATRTATPTKTPIPAPVKVNDAAPPLVGAVSAVVIDENSGAVLYAKNAHLSRAPASITKIVTAIVALESGRLDDLVTVRYDPSELVDSTVMGVEPGDRITLLDLLYGLMLPSGNDAALAIANHIAGSSEAFAALMNAKMDDLGLTDSHFVNPHGLDERGHYTSAYDITMVTRYAMRDATFRNLAAARLWEVTIHTPNRTKQYPVYNLNNLLNTYRGADGVKIGYTEAALRTIVGSATRDGHRVYATAMGSNNLVVDTAPLLDYAFKNHSWPAQ